MNKEELLRKYRNEEQDEGKDYVNQSADTFAFYGMIVFASLIMIYQIYADIAFGDVTSLLFSFIAIGGFQRYRKTKKTYFLTSAIFNTVISIACITWYIYSTL